MSLIKRKNETERERERERGGDRDATVGTDCPSFMLVELGSQRVRRVPLASCDIDGMPIALRGSAVVFPTAG